MKLLLISADIEEIREGYTFGVFSGVASNPSVVAKKRVRTEAMLKQVLNIIPDPVFVQVASLSTSEILKEARTFSAINPARVIVKIPATEAGIRAIYILSKDQIRTAATAVFSANEALLAARAGASFVAPYLARIRDGGGDAEQVVRDVVDLTRIHDLSIRVVVASIRNTHDLYAAWKAGAHFGAVKLEVVQEICADRRARRAAERFYEDSVSWQEP